jgi:hypothetical protein
MKWDGDFEFTLDDRTFLRAIQIVEGEDEGWTKPPSGFPGYGVATIRSHVIDKHGFGIVRENEHLRSLLRAFLEANIRVADQREILKSELERSFVTRWMRKSIIRNLEADLKDLEVKRDEAFKKYEMLRRLTDWENVLLKRVPA